VATYSYSRLTTYETCPLRYKFRYIDRIKKDVTGIEAFLGICAHRTLQKLYEDLMREKTNSLDDLITYFNNIWSKNWTPNIYIVKKKYTEDNYRRTGERCLRDYYRRCAPFNQSQTLGIEERITIKLGSQYHLIGYIDRLSKAPDGTYEIHDYKTTGRLPDQNTIDQDRQLALYQIAIKQRWPDVKRIRLIWHFLLFDQEMRSIRTDYDLAKLSGNIINLIRQVEEAQSFEPKESALCDWCEYAPECPIQKHRFKIDSLPVNQYLSEEGVELVNKYMKIVEEKRALIKKHDAELEPLKEAILSYAERENAQVLKGIDYKLKIRKEKRLQLPDPKDPRRAELESLIRETRLWGKLSTLHASKLSDFLSQSNLDPAIAQKIRSLCTVQESCRLYPSKIKETERLFDALIDE
jgi:putative RecB family exonuclease